MSVIKSIRQIKIQVFEKLKKTDYCFYQINCAIYGKAKSVLLKIKNSQMISLK